MAIGLAATVLNGWVDALCRATNYTAPTAFWVKLHLGDPGAGIRGTGAGAAFGQLAVPHAALLRDARDSLAGRARRRRHRHAGVAARRRRQ